MGLKREIEIGSHHYVNLQEMGVGGMAVVYKGKFEALNIPVVVKVLRSQKGGSFFDVEETFKREAELTCQLQHPNIVKVHDFDTSAPVKIVFDYVDGLDLRDVQNLVGHISDVETLVAMEWVCYALEEAHKRGIYHRDISPGNIIISQETYRSMLMDFGIAATEEQYKKMYSETREKPVGVLKYMSPEQLSGKRVDERSDIFSAGRVIVGMLTGRDPRYVNLDQKKLPIKKDIKHICKIATAEISDERFESAAKLRESIKRYLWKEKVRTVGDVERVLKKVLERAYASKDILEERIDQTWKDINYLSDMLEINVTKEESLKFLAEERRDLVEEIFEEELIKEVGGTRDTLFVSLQKIKKLSFSRFKEIYKKIYEEKNNLNGGSGGVRQNISNYLNYKLVGWRGYIATLLKIDPLGYKSIVGKTDAMVVKVVNMYNHEHIFNYELKVKKSIHESYDRALRMIDLILRQLDPENKKYVELSGKIKDRMGTLDEQIKLEEKR